MYTIILHTVYFSLVIRSLTIQSKNILRFNQNHLSAFSDLNSNFRVQQEGMATSNCNDKESYDKYSEILIQNGITSEIKEIQTFVPKLGDHFSSRCECVSVYFKDSSLKPLELFVKKTVTNDEYAVLLKDMELFQTEETFFNTILVDMKDYIRQKNGFDLEGVLPKCYYADREIVVLENLIKNGYVLLDKNNGHTFEQSSTVLKSLAKLHGTSYLVVNELGEEEFLAKYPFLAEARMWSAKGAPINAPVLQSIFDTTIKILRRFPTTGSDGMLEHVFKYEKDGFSKLSRHFDLKNPFCAKVLCHGDMWNANLLFKDNDETKEIDGCAIIDFQTVHLGSPASDVARYMFTAVDTAVRRQSWKSLLEVYYNSFTETVEKLQGVTKFSLENLITDFCENVEPAYFFGVHSVFGKAMEDVPDIENIEGNVMDTLNSTFNEAMEKHINEEGKDYSVLLVEAFREFQAINKQ